MANTLLRLGAGLITVWLLQVQPLRTGAAEPAADDVAAHLAEADELLLRGRYSEALQTYQKLPGEPAAFIGIARCHLAEGRLSDATKVLIEAVAQDEDSAALHAELALVGLETGDTKLAADESAAALKLDPNSLPARWVAAEILRISGKLPEAEKAYGWFIDRQRQLTISRQPLTAESVYWIGLGAAQHARWTRNHKLFSTLVNDLYPSALKDNEQFWPAALQTALLFHEKYNEPEALAAIAAGLAINPNAADLHAARADIAVRSFDVVVAGKSIQRAQEINPRHVWASQLAADVHMINTDPAKAVKSLEATLKHRPRDEQTLGRMLGCFAALDGGTIKDPSDRMKGLIESASQQNPHCGELFLAAGDALDRMRRYEQAAAFYRESHQRMPQLSAAHSQLGMTLMRLGDEKEAAAVLEEAFKVDPFHVRVKNTLEVLDLLQGYAVLETEHFVLKFDRGQDELLARYAAKHLEDEVYPRVVKTLGFAPPEKTLFEIFSRAKNTSGHGWFSARMVGLPAIGTVGACAGKMVAITSPRELPKKYNWAKVLGHEFVHVVNLQQTDFNVPHWLTEGIAVYLEDQPRPAEWTELLVKRHKAGTLFDLDDILFGFVRPQQKEDWTLAYCQAELYVDYARQTFGEDAIARLLAAYGERLATAEALPKAYEVSQAEFERGYRDFIAKIAVEQTADANASLSLDEAQRRAEATPDEADAAATVAELYLRRGDFPRARQWAQKALKLDTKSAAANYVLARLQLSIGDTEGALKLLEGVYIPETPHQASLALLAAMAVQKEDLAAAEKYFELGRQKFPGSDRWTKGLASIYLKHGNDEKLRTVLAELAEHDPDNVTMRRKLAQLALDAEDYETARHWAQELVHLNVEDAEAHSSLGKALAGLRRSKEAAEESAVAKELSRQ